MGKSILEILQIKNEFPVIFIGSGISKRYLLKYPSWEELLEELWEKTGNSNFFGHLSKTKDAIKRTGITDDSMLNFMVNTLVASQVEEKVNANFYDKSIEIEGLSQKDAYKNNLSPFKKLLSNRFSKYQIKESFQNELEYFREMLIKTQIILTTNYDTFIEDQYNSKSLYGVQKYIGQQGFFKQTPGYAEIYKIHGCTTEPSSLIINEKDYSYFDKNSILISAKIISMLLHSPIIFMGYSLTDRNVRKIIKDFTSSLRDEEKVELEKRLIVVQWKENCKDIEEEIVIDKELGCRLTVIKTDNFSEIYRKIASINQGVAPSEVRRYQHVIKQLIIDRGRKGDLKAVLVSPSELDELEENIGNKNIVVAIGDSKLIFNMPNTIDYIIDYVSEATEQNIDTMLRFLASQQPSSLLPFKKYVTEDTISNSSLVETEKTKLRKRIANQGTLSVQIDALVFKELYNSLKEIKDMNFLPYREYSLVAYNIDRIGLDQVKDYILEEMKKCAESGENKVITNLKRLVLIYDLKKNG